MYRAKVNDIREKALTQVANIPWEVDNETVEGIDPNPCGERPPESQYERKQQIPPPGARFDKHGNWILVGGSGRTGRGRKGNKPKKTFDPTITNPLQSEGTTMYRGGQLLPTDEDIAARDREYEFNPGEHERVPVRALQVHKPDEQCTLLTTMIELKPKEGET